MGRQNSSLSDEQGKWVLLKFLWFFSTKPLFNKTHVDKKQGKWVLLKWFFFQQNPFQQKARKMGFSFNKTHLSEVYKNQKIAELQSSSFKPQIIVHMHLRELEFWSHSHSFFFQCLSLPMMEMFWVCKVQSVQLV
jgi:hypothetical protein